MATPSEQAEWNDPQNWHGGWLGIYVAPRDPRLVVPKRIPVMGWTLNFAHRGSWLALACLLLPALAILIAERIG